MPLALAASSYCEHNSRSGSRCDWRWARSGTDNQGAIVERAASLGGNAGREGAEAPFGQALMMQCQGAGTPTTDMGEMKDNAKPKRGLSPFLLARNNYMKTVKAAKGGMLTRTELQHAHSEFRARWDSLPDKSGFAEAYSDWQQLQDSALPTESAIYKCLWGGGCLETPISCQEVP